MGPGNGMELRHLKYYQAVVREGGFGKAAAVLNLAQPALSRQIRDLEEELGVELLTRTPKGVITTAPGDTFAVGAEPVLQAVRQALEAARLAATGRVGRIHLGVGRIAMAERSIAEMLNRLVEAERGMDLMIQEVDAFQQPQRLTEGTLDLGLGQWDDKLTQLEHEVWIIGEFRCAVLAADHPLAGKAILEPEDLAEVPVAFMSEDRAPELAALFRRALDRAGIRSPREFIYTSPNSAVMMVAAGRCWGPASANARAMHGMVIVPVRGLDWPVRLDLLWRKDETRPVVHRLLDTLRRLRDEKPAAPGAAPPARDLVPPGLELRHLRYFAAVAEEGSFGKAATRLGVTQPSLSRQVADLEHLVGATLLERNSRGVTVTDAGTALRRSATRVFDAVDDLVSATHGARRGVAGRCVIGAVQTVVSARVLAAASRFVAEAWPQVEIVLEEYPTPAQPDALRNGQIDIGVCHSYPSLVADDPELEHDRLIEDTINSALLADSHPLASRASITAGELAGIPFLFMPRSYHSAFYDRVFHALTGLGLAPRVDATYESLQHVWMLAGEGQGWALGFDSHHSRSPIGVRAVPVEGLALPWGLDLLWRRREPNPVVAKVLGAFRTLRAQRAEGGPAHGSVLSSPPGSDTALDHAAGTAAITPR